MSYEIKENYIMLTRGDTLSIPMNFHQDITGAVIKMQVYENGNFTPIISREVSDHYDAKNGKTVFEIPGDLTNIPVGEYKTDINIRFSNNNVYTFYPPRPSIEAKFIVKNRISE